jgi:hypothetical protein
MRVKTVARSSAQHCRNGLRSRRLVDLPEQILLLLSPRLHVQVTHRFDLLSWV